jgi:nicotinamidase-related amidase
VTVAPPKTLLQLAGAPLDPSPLDQATLVLIDCQREYLDGKLALPGVKPAIAEAARLLELARAKGVPVVHIVHHGRPGGALFAPDGPMAAIVPELSPRAGEPVIAKSLPNAFAKTDLEATLQKTGRPQLILAGFMTHMCVSATAKAAVDLGRRVTVVANATATRDLPDPLGGTMPAEQVHRAALAGLADRFAIVVPGAAAWTQ